MYIQPGTILKSTPALAGDFFEDSSIVITTCNSDGSIGFVINKVFERPLNELQEFRHIRKFNLYDGGPVDREHLFFLHCRPDVIEDGRKLCDGVFYGGNFAQAVNAINNTVVTSSHIKIFVGYCGWDAGELEAEVKEGCWEISGNSTLSVFST